MNPSNASVRCFLGIDLGGTNVKSGVVDDSGRVLSSVSVPTEARRGPVHGIGQIAAAARQAISAANRVPSEMTAAGLATPGPMDIPAGRLLEPANLPGWWNLPIRQQVAAAIGLPTTLQNDANAAAWGEYWVGAGRDVRSLVLFTLGTGLGGGIIVNDQIIEGQHSHGSECGHVVIEMDDGRLCATGQYGTAEAYCSATALLTRFREALNSGRVSSVSHRVGAGASVTPQLIAEEAEKGDALSVELILEMARCLGAAVTSVVHVIDPAMVLLGGAMTFGRHDTQIGREFLQRVRQEFRTRTFASLADKVKIDYAALGGNAGFIGAAGWARRMIDRTAGDFSAFSPAANPEP